jgi:aminopeptidase
MRDSRIDALAQILVRYSTNVQPGETCAIRATTNAEPLVQAIYEEVLRAGGHPFFVLSPVEALPAFFELANDEQLEYIPEPMRWPYEKADVAFAIMAESNTRALSQVDPAKQSRVQKARKPLLNASMERSASGEHRWALTMFPTHAYAADAGMSLARFEEFLYRACLAYDDDPVTAWERQSDTVRRLADWMDGREEIRLQAPGGTDITLNIAGRGWIPCYGDHNMPDGEFFTGPVEDSANGTVAFSFPTTYQGREVGGVVLKFENGKVVDATAETGEDLLLQTLDTDEGARRLGELGIGTNYGIKTGTKEILLDEKIGGTFHLALGASYPETGGVNDSAVHWDMICDLRQGGSITVDGEALQKDGQFLV